MVALTIAMGFAAYRQRRWTDDDMSVARRTILFGVLAGASLSGAPVQARRLPPKEVAPVVVGGVRYKVPHFGALHGKAQNGGYVQAWDVKSKKLLWDRLIYRVRYDANRVKCVQDVFITNLRIRGGLLFVKNERSQEFEMDLLSGRVRSLTGLTPNVDVPLEHER